MTTFGLSTEKQAMVLCTGAERNEIIRRTNIFQQMIQAMDETCRLKSSNI